MSIIRGSALAALNGTDDEIGKNAILELMNAVDEDIPLPPRDLDKPFLMPIEDVFSISGRGTVVTGRIETGVITVGEDVEIIGIKEKPIKTVATGVEMFKKSLDRGEAGDNVGILVRGLKRDEVERGQVIAKPGIMHTPLGCAPVLTRICIVNGKQALSRLARPSNVSCTY